MSNTRFISGTHAVISADTTQLALEFLFTPNVTCTEAWVLAKASTHGPLQVRLFNDNFSPASDSMTIYASGDSSRVKLPNVNLVPSDTPQVYRLLVTNTAGVGDAVVEGVMLVC